MRKKGFTLIELLVVIAIIALLLSILMPSLQKVKESARSLVCRSNQKQLGLGFQTYYMDYNSKALISTGEDNFWFFQLGPYLADKAFTADTTGDPETELGALMKTIKCVSTQAPTLVWDPSRSPDVQGIAGTAQNQYRYHVFRAEGSYAINRWVGGWIGEEFDTSPITISATVRNNIGRSYRRGIACAKSDVPLLGDAIWVDALPRASTYPVPTKAELDTGLWDDLGRYCIDRHGMKTNIAYCDGHVEQIKLTELWAQKWNKEFDPKRDVTFPSE